MSVSDHLAPLLALLRAAYPHDVPAEDYMPLLVVLQADMSERNLAEVVGALTGRDPATVANDAAASVSREKPNPEEVSRVRRILEQVGWEPEL
jgi:hypothetical protein